jgi:hypothetical protein
MESFLGQDLEAEVRQFGYLTVLVVDPHSEKRYANCSGDTLGNFLSSPKK